MNRVGIITQARMTSSRLPGKVMHKVDGETLLALHVERLKDTGYPVVIATTTNGTDDVIVQEARKLEVRVFRGSEHDVLGRFAAASRENAFDTVVRVTSDCPLIDSSLICEGVARFIELNDEFAYVSNTLERTFPRGFDFEVFSAARLHEADLAAKTPYEREHVTPWVIASEATNRVSIKQDRDQSRYRVTVDTKDDYELIRVMMEQNNLKRQNHEKITGWLIEHSTLFDSGQSV